MTARRAKNTTRQGANFELRIMDYLAERGYDVLRSSGSRGKVDVVAVGDKHILFIQAKISKPVIPPAERRAVRAMALRADAVPLVAYRVPGSVLFRELTGDGPKDWLMFEPVTHDWVPCGGCGFTYARHREGSTCPDAACEACPCGAFTFNEKESKV